MITSSGSRSARVVCWAAFAALVSVLFLSSGCATGPASASSKPDTAPVSALQVDPAVAQWINPKLNFGGDDFRFAIIPDRCGGHKPGVYEKALDAINLMQPELVVTVGDQIEGYTQDPVVMTNMWNEYNGLVSRLSMPLFRVPGNHDLSNPEMDAMWDRMLGKRYYWFTYKKVLFLCLNSNEGPKREGLSEEQIAWAKDVIARNSDVHWTCVFMHHPLWLYEEGDSVTQRKTISKKRNTGFPEIEKALVNRNYTVFTGHFHEYIKCVRNGRAYYVFASAGADSANRGVDYGEFYHIASVTMTSIGPVVANLLIDGVLPDDVFTEQHLQAMRYTRFSTNSLLPATPDLAMQFTLTSSNPFPRDVNIDIAWNLPQDCQWSVIPKQTNAVIPSGAVCSMEVKATLTKPGADALPLPALETHISGDKNISIRKTLPLPLDVKRYLLTRLPEVRCVYQKTPVVVDGKLDDAAWQTAEVAANLKAFTLDRKPSVSTEFRTAYDSDKLYISARCAEPNMNGIQTLATERDGNVWADDGIEVLVATDAQRTNHYQFVVSPSGVMFDGCGWDNSWNGKWESAATRDKDGWQIEVAIPWTTLGISVPAPDSRLGIQMVRNRPQTRETLQWSLSPDGNHDATMFGNARFSSSAP